MKQNIGKTLRNVAFYIVVAVLLMYITIQVVAPDLTITVFRFKPYVVITESMEPVLNVNDLVIVKNFDVDELQEEDIITFYADVNYDGETEIVTHYIYSITDTDDGPIIRTHRYYENEADYTPDPWVLLGDDVLGLYSFHVPWIGAVSLFLQSPFGIAAVIVNLGVIGGIIYLIKTSPSSTSTKQEETDEKIDN